MRVGCTVQSMLRSGRSVRILGCEVHSRGRTPHGVRGLKLLVDDGRGVQVHGRTPHGVRGLKSLLPARFPGQTSRTPHGVRGLKSANPTSRNLPASRTPHGVRGLKLYIGTAGFPHTRSHPSRGAWIEIVGVRFDDGGEIVAPLTGCVD